MILFKTYLFKFSIQIQNLSVRASRPQNPEVDIGTGAVTLSDIIEEETEVKISIIGEKAEHWEAVEEKNQERASAVSTYIEWNVFTLK